MSWRWLALTDERPPGALAAARVASGGWLAAWEPGARPERSALRVHPQLVDPEGAAAWISLVRPPEGVALPFDDLAVAQARRDVLARPAFDAVSTLLRDASHFEGAITVARGGDVERLRDDPFARIFAARLLSVEAGVLGRMDPPAGPVIERYGSSEPWPWDRYAPATGAPCGPA